TGANESGRVDVKDVLYNGSLGGTTATVQGGSNIDALGDVTVEAGTSDKASIIAGGGNLAVAVAVGAAVGVIDIANRVDAAVLGGSTVASRGDIRIAATAGRLDRQDADDTACEEGTASSVCAYQGGGGIVSLGAAVAVNPVANEVSARAARGVSLAASGA